MKILLVEDDLHKRRALTALLMDSLANVELIEAQSVTSASARLQDQDFDLVLLDMSLPTYDVTTRESGGRPQGFGGVDLMMLIEALNLRAKVILVSQFPEFGEGSQTTDLKTLGSRLKSEYPANFLGWVFFEQSSDRWKTELAALLAQQKATP